jgi:hypothetical protein
VQFEGVLMVKQLKQKRYRTACQVAQPERLALKKQLDAMDRGGSGIGEP